MDCLPELVVAKRKTISSSKMAKRLRRFVGENQRSDAPEDGDDDARNATKPAASGELLCRIPEETLFQLQQIYEALEGAISGVKPASSAPSLTDLIAASAGDNGEAEPSGGNEASVVTPEKTTKQKRVRGGEEPATASKAKKGSSIGASPKMMKKKARRKSNAT
ncbi:unnamed protein product [Ectocarpus sp. 12 AP-2014]